MKKRLIGFLTCCLLILSSCTATKVSLVGRGVVRLDSVPTGDPFVVAKSQERTAPDMQYCFDVRLDGISLRLGDTIAYYGGKLSFDVSFSASVRISAVGFVLSDGVPCVLSDGSLQYAAAMTAGETDTRTVSVIPPVSKYGLQKLSFVWLVDGSETYVFDLLLDVRESCPLQAPEASVQYETLPLSEEDELPDEYGVLSVVYRDGSKKTRDGWKMYRGLQYNLTSEKNLPLCFEATAPMGEYASVFLINGKIVPVWDGKTALQWGVREQERILVKPFAMPTEPDETETVSYDFCAVSVSRDVEILGKVDCSDRCSFYGAAQVSDQGRNRGSLRSSFWVKDAESGKKISAHDSVLYQGGPIDLQVDFSAEGTFLIAEHVSFQVGFLVCVNGTPVPFSVDGAPENLLHTVSGFGPVTFDLSFTPPLADDRSDFYVQVFQVHALRGDTEQQIPDSVSMFVGKFTPQGDLTENLALYRHDVAESEIWTETEDWSGLWFGFHAGNCLDTSPTCSLYSVGNETVTVQIKGGPLSANADYETFVLGALLDGALVPLNGNDYFVRIDRTVYSNNIAMEFDVDCSDLSVGAHTLMLIVLPVVVDGSKLSAMPRQQILGGFDNLTFLKIMDADPVTETSLILTESADRNGALLFDFGCDGIRTVSVSVGDVLYCKTVSSDISVPYVRNISDDEVSVCISDYSTDVSLCVSHYRMTDANWETVS